MSQLLLEENEYNQLKDITLNITFNFNQLSGFYSLIVYKKTIEWVLACESNDALFHFDGCSSGEMYISAVDGMAQKYNASETELEGLSYPSLELRYKNKKITPSDSIYARVQNPIKEFICNGEIININKEYANHAPCALNDLTIRITGRLEYINCNEIDKKFDITKI